VVGGEAATGGSLVRRVRRGVRRSLGRIDSRFTNDPDWTIGVLGGSSPRNLGPIDGVANPVITAGMARGAPRGFVADPFALRVDDRWYVFYEAMDLWSRRGRIALSSSSDLRTWRHHGTVLSEPFHLSYPYVLQDGDDVYMIPEAFESGAVRLYRADPFPSRWVHVADLLTGPVLLDPSPFRTDAAWWMFVDTHESAYAGRLELFMAQDLVGPWTPHPMNPIVDDDPGSARPAGRVVRWDDGLVRLTQDCSLRYGDAVHAMRIDVLEAGAYQESMLARRWLSGTDTGWNAGSMHHADLHRQGDGWVAFVDGHGS
jgi:hypothetical protein